MKKVTVRTRVKITGIVLIVITGLLNFHPPHFLLESHKSFGATPSSLEFGLFMLVIAALVSAVGICKNLQWGWILGVVVSIISVLLWLTQETIGLPGFPKMWFEPSRIVALIIEIAFVVTTCQVVWKKFK